jgi:hypothetical protein
MTPLLRRHARVLSLIALAACAKGPPWSAPSVTARLRAAGFVVTSAPNPGIAGPGIASVECLDAAKSGATDTLCVVTCASASGCQAFTESTWESYGMFPRRSTLLIHQVCGRPTGATLSFDCRPARAALGF